MVRQLRPLIRIPTEARELYDSVKEQLPQCMGDSDTSAPHDTSSPAGRKRAADDVLPGPPQKRPALEDEGCCVFEDRARFYALGVHIEQDEADPLVFGSAIVGPDQTENPVGLISVGRPHLLTIDQKMIAFVLGLGGQRRQIGTG